MEVSGEQFMGNWRWQAAGLVAASVCVGGSVLALYPTFIVGSHLPGIILILLRVFGGTLAILGGLCIIIARTPRLLFGVSLMRTMRTNHKKKLNRWDEIVKGKLVLGAIPFRNDILPLTTPVENGGLGITSVLIMLQEHELKPIFGYCPATLDDWKKADVTVKHITTPDYESVSSQELIAGADFIHQQISDGGKIYVHCKSGKGRSTMCCAVYLVKYCGVDMEEVIKVLRAKRPQVKLNPQQQKGMMEACKLVKETKK